MCWCDDCDRLNVCFLLIEFICRLNDAKPCASTIGPNSPRKFTYTSTGCAPNNSTEFKFGSTDDSPRSPKITYTTPPASGNSVTSGHNMESENNSNTTTPSSGYYEPKSPQYTPYDHHSPRKSPKSPRQFVFDAVSPRRESIGSYRFVSYFIVMNSFLCFAHTHILYNLCLCTAHPAVLYNINKYILTLSWPYPLSH